MFRKLAVAAIALVVSAAAVPSVQAQCNKYDRSGCGRDWFREATHNLRSIPRTIIRDGQEARAEIGRYYARRQREQYYDASYSRIAVSYDVPMGYYNMGHRYPFDACQYGRRGGCTDYTPIQILEDGIAVWRIVETAKLRKELERANDRAEEARRDTEEHYRNELPTRKSSKMVDVINMTSGGLSINNGNPLKPNGYTRASEEGFFADSDLPNCEEARIQINEKTIGVICR